MSFGSNDSCVLCFVFGKVTDRAGELRHECQRHMDGAERRSRLIDTYHSRQVWRNRAIAATYPFTVLVNTDLLTQNRIGPTWSFTILASTDLLLL